MAAQKELIIMPPAGFKSSWRENSFQHALRTGLNKMEPESFVTHLPVTGCRTVQFVVLMLRGCAGSGSTPSMTTNSRGLRTSVRIL